MDVLIDIHFLVSKLFLFEVHEAEMCRASYMLAGVVNTKRDWFRSLE